MKKYWYVGWYTVSGLGSDVGGRLSSGDGGEVVLDVWGEVGSSYVSSVVKHVKGGVNVILDDSVGLGVSIVVDNVVCRCIDGEVMI